MSNTDDSIVIIRLEENGNGGTPAAHIRDHNVSQPSHVPRKKRGRRRTVGRRRQPTAGGGGQTVKIIAILLSAALSLCWIVACLLVFHQDAPAPHSLHDFRHPLGSLRQVYREGLEQQKELEKRDIGVVHAEYASIESAGNALGPSGRGDATISSMASEMDSPLIIFTFRRADYLRRTLTAVWNHYPVNKAKHRKGEGGHMAFPIVVSQDGDNGEVKTVIEEFLKKFRDAGVPAFHISHPKSPQGKLRGTDAYKALAVHFGWALKKLFAGDAYREGGTSSDYDSTTLPLPQRAIILEEDIEIAPDFFSFMHATAPLLDSDPTLLAVSAFNDNGKEGIVGDVKRLVRSDFFPGLGWMIPRRIWDEIGPKWPDGWWDDWIREPEQRRGRQTIRPEVSRTYHFGSEKGASYNQFGEELLDIKLDKADLAWEKEDLSYLERDRFRQDYYSRVLNARFSTWGEAMQKVKEGDVRVEYNRWNQYTKNVPHLLPVMTDEKAGVPRTAFEAIVETRPYGQGGHLMFFTPPAPKLRENLNRGKTMDILQFSETLRVVPPPEI